MSEQLTSHRLDKLDKQIEGIDIVVNDVVKRIVIVEQEQQVLSKNINSLTKHTEAILAMGYELKNLNSKMEDILKNMGKQEKRIEEQEKKIIDLLCKPGNRALVRWELVITTIITTVVGFVVGFFL